VPAASHGPFLLTPLFVTMDSRYSLDGQEEEDLLSPGPCQLHGLGRGRKLLEVSQGLGDEVLLGLVKLYEGAGILLQL